MDISHVLAKAALAAERFSNNLGDRNTSEERLKLKPSLEASLLDKPGYSSPQNITKANNAISNSGVFAAAIAPGLDKKLVNNQLVAVGHNLNLAA